MRLKMLIGMSGNGFVLDPGDVTERFDDKEATRLIANGFAEKAPPVEKKKPVTKQEWDDEREALIAENEALKATVLAVEEREIALLSRVEKQDALLSGLRAGLNDLDPAGQEPPANDAGQSDPATKPAGKADVV